MKHLFKLDFSDGYYHICQIGAGTVPTEAEIAQVKEWGHIVIEMDDDEYQRWERHQKEAGEWQEKFRVLDNEAVRS